MVRDCGLPGDPGCVISRNGGWAMDAQTFHGFLRALKANPNEIASYVNRGEVFLRQGKVLEAAQDFKKAVDLDPQGKDPLTQRARVLAAAALETIEAAQEEKKSKGAKK